MEDIHIRDPYVLPLPDEKRYLLFGTMGHATWGGPGIGFDCYTSPDLETWEGPIPAFRPPADFWSNTQFWAPECHPYQGRYYLFATFARDKRQRGTQILIADRPEGPYVPHSEGPVTPRDWECLDGTLFVDATGAPWIVFCHEWVQVEDGEICALRLSDDLSRPIGEPQLLFRASSAPWSKPIVRGDREDNYVTDGPFMHRCADGRLIMLWSTMGEQGYAMGYALSESGTLRGPWHPSPEPLFGKDGGHGMIFRTFEGRLMVTLHTPNATPHERPAWFEIVETDAGLALVNP